MTKTKAEIDIFAKDLKTAYESKEKGKISELKSWKIDKANDFVQKIEND